MWIKHNHALYNSNDIMQIEAVRTKLYATFKDGVRIIIGEFRATKECEDIFTSLTRALLFEDKDHPGVIIKDTKEKKKYVANGSNKDANA